MTDRKRIAYLDIARGIGMILVVLGHVEYVDITLRQFVSAFHMPLFFLISGILIGERQEEKRDYPQLIRRKLKSIMLPYIIFSLLSFMIEGGRIALKGLDEWDVVFRQLFQSLCLQGVSTLWFLPALFMSELIFIGIRKKSSNSFTILTIWGIVIVVFYLNTIEQSIFRPHRGNLEWELWHDVISMLLRNVFCVGFVGLGYYAGKYLFPHIMKKWISLLTLIVSISVACIIIPMNWGVDLRYMNLGRLDLFLLGALSGTMMILSVSKLLENLPVIKYLLEYYGRNSLIIMVTHMDFRVLYCSIKLAAILQQLWNNQIIFNLSIIVLVFLIEIPFIWFVNRYLSFILGKNRKIS